MAQEIFKMSEDEYLELCRQRYRGMSEIEQNKITLRRTVDTLAKSLAVSKFQDKTYDADKKELHIKKMTSALHTAMYVIIRCKFAIPNMFFLNYEDIPEAIHTAKQVANIISEGV